MGLGLCKIKANSASLALAGAELGNRIFFSFKGPPMGLGGICLIVVGPISVDKFPATDSRDSWSWPYVAGSHFKALSKRHLTTVKEPISYKFVSWYLDHLYFLFFPSRGVGG